MDDFAFAVAIGIISAIGAAAVVALICFAATYSILYTIACLAVLAFVAGFVYVMQTI